MRLTRQWEQLIHAFLLVTSSKKCDIQFKLHETKIKKMAMVHEETIQWLNVFIKDAIVHEKMDGDW